MKKILVVIGCVFTLAACSDAPTAERILAQNGYKNIKTTGYSMFSCADSDAFATGFVATSPNGTKVRGVVCSGWMKGGTIRFF